MKKIVKEIKALGTNGAEAAENIIKAIVEVKENSRRVRGENRVIKINMNKHVVKTLTPEVIRHMLHMNIDDENIDMDVCVTSDVSIYGEGYSISDDYAKADIAYLKYALRLINDKGYSFMILNGLFRYHDSMTVAIVNDIFRLVSTMDLKVDTFRKFVEYVFERSVFNIDEDKIEPIGVPIKSVNIKGICSVKEFVNFVDGFTEIADDKLIVNSFGVIINQGVRVVKISCNKKCDVVLSGRTKDDISAFNIINASVDDGYMDISASHYVNTPMYSGNIDNIKESVDNIIYIDRRVDSIDYLYNEVLFRKALIICHSDYEAVSLYRIHEDKCSIKCGELMIDNDKDVTIVSIDTLCMEDFNDKHTVIIDSCIDITTDPRYMMYFVGLKRKVINLIFNGFLGNFEPNIERVTGTSIIRNHKIPTDIFPDNTDKSCLISGALNSGNTALVTKGKFLYPHLSRNTPIYERLLIEDGLKNGSIKFITVEAGYKDIARLNLQSVVLGVSECGEAFMTAQQLVSSSEDKYARLLAIREDITYDDRDVFMNTRYIVNTLPQRNCGIIKNDVMILAYINK